ncbi:MAG: hypothetical protein U0641_01165 [Anaerolineae bacterium]
MGRPTPERPSAEDTATHTVVVTFGDGHAEKWTWIGSAYDGASGVFGILTKTTDGAFDLTQKDQTHYHFTSAAAWTMSTTTTPTAPPSPTTPSRLTTVTEPTRPQPHPGLHLAGQRQPRLRCRRPPRPQPRLHLQHHGRA